MWLLADLFNDLPEVGDLDKPKLVFFFDVGCQDGRETPLVSSAGNGANYE
jgi:hypothetical protein